MLRNRLLRVLVLVSLVGVAACDELSGKNGKQCGRCSGDGDCKGGRQCFSFSDGNSRCAQRAGDLCTTGLSSVEPSPMALELSGPSGAP
jgi:hypothetical protein